jgi:signal transduction histidine kinase
MWQTGFPSAGPGRHPDADDDAAPHRRSPALARLLFPVIAALVFQVVTLVVLRHVQSVAGSGPGQPLALQLAVAVAGPLALLAARRLPGPVVAVVSLAAAVNLFVGPAFGAAPYLALAFAIVSAVVRGARGWAWISVGTAWVASIAAATLLQVSWPGFRIAATTFAILLVFGVSESVRGRRERWAVARARDRDRRASDLQAERVRIARELHDVLAHSLSQINVQAGVGLHLMDSRPDQARDALASIKATSKSALDEVRSVLGVLRAELPGTAPGGRTDPGSAPDAPLVPEPDLSRLPALVASLAAQGVEVTVGKIPAKIPAGMQLALFRITQESLTNVARHSGARSATVRITDDPAGYTLTVTDDGSGPPTPHTPGRGMLGMRERAEILGGALTAGAAPAGGFQVHARIPHPTASGRDDPDRKATE